MKIGLLWFDDTPEPKGSTLIPHKIEDAARRYHERFGTVAKVCYVNPATVVTQPPMGITIKESPSVGRHYFLVGEEDARAA